MIKIFLYYTLFFGLILTICSFILTPKVKDTTDRAEKSANGIQVLGVALFCISATILLCGADIKDSSKKDIFLGLLILASGIVITTLASIVHTDCEDAKALSSVLIGFGVLSIVLSFVFFGLKFKNRKVSNSTETKGIEMTKGDAPGAAPGGAKTAATPDASKTGAGAGPAGAKGGVGDMGSAPAGVNGVNGGTAVAGEPAASTEGSLKRGGDANTAGIPEKSPFDKSKLSEQQKEKCKKLLDEYTTCLEQNTGTRASTQLVGG